MRWPVSVISLLCSLSIGVGWIGYGRLYRLGPPFAWSGWMTAVWFLPALVAASMQKRSGIYVPGLILACEAAASAISGAFGDLGWVSLHFGLAQGLAGEITYSRRSSCVAVAAACAFADLILLHLHPYLGALRQFSYGQWGMHYFGVLCSSMILAAFFSLWGKK